MTTTISISADQTTTVVATQVDTTWTVEEGVTVHVVSGVAIDGSSLYAGRAFVIDGSLISDDNYGLYLGGTGEYNGDANSILIGETGSVSGFYTAITTSGYGTYVENNGQISGTNGIMLGSENGTFFNKGTTSGDYSAVYVNFEDIKIENSGIVSGNVYGVISFVSGTSIENSGEISSSNSSGASVYLSGSHSDLTNSGSISGPSAIVVKDSACTIENTGTVSATIVGITLGDHADTILITNAGTIAGDTSAIVSTGGTLKLVSSGTITGATILGYANDTVRNSGSMTDLDLGGGNDRFDGRGGAVSGVVAGGLGDDIFILDSKTDVVEKTAGGTDTIKSTTSVTFSAGVLAGQELENLTLLGTKNFNGTGNDLDNTIKGNSGNNHLSGVAGADILTGGKGVDIFIFKTGFGHDTVTDFGLGADRIDLSDFTAVTSFADLMAHHVSKSGADLIIHAGTDLLTFEDTSKTDLQASDFIF